MMRRALWRRSRVAEVLLSGCKGRRVTRVGGRLGASDPIRLTLHAFIILVSERVFCVLKRE